MARGVALLALLAAAGCAKVNDTALRLVSTPVEAHAVVAGQLLTGEVVLVPDRTGRVSLRGDADSTLSCVGGMRYTASNAGVVDLRCNDGTELVLQYTLLSETRGYAYGVSAAVPASLVFGLAAPEAAAYLRPPAGKTLLLRDGLLQLQ